MEEAIRVETRRRDAGSKPDAQRDMENVQRLAELLDTEFSIGGIRFGLDAIIGLLPVVGDSISLLIGLYPLYVAQQHKLGFFVRGRMLLNLVFDWLIGLIPFLGDLFDVGFKANIRNADILRRALEVRRP
ncbi:MAG TPA: DUF4112 domain-containing protein [Tepidisphaeraceae bacterium]|jgi:hypothetical protein|nr:DUF4112 domain-containing protein [Tepidisphaeraceae bacterium]